MSDAACPLCDGDGGILVHRTARWRVVRVADDDFPAYYRLIWNAHRAEFTDLPAGERAEAMAAVAAVESVLRAQLAPDKINLAALGNMVPHLHWHVVARFAWDSHFPQAIWGPRQREVAPAAAVRLAVQPEELDRCVAQALASLTS